MPNINKNAGRKEMKTQDIGTRLHDVQKDQEEKIKKRKMEEEQKIKSLSNKKFVQESSEKMAEKLEKEKLKTIFEALDSDQDGVISSDKIDIQGKAS
jgi:Ca2+-binding EF-hand superfamily protein